MKWKLFGKKESAIFKMVVDNGNGFYSWNGKLYQSDIVRACIKPKTKAIGKAVAKHIRKEIKDGVTSLAVFPSVNMRFLLEEPNELMTGQMLQEKVANQLQLNGNAFILIIRDANGVPVGLYPIPCTSVMTKYDESGKLYLKFTYQNGKWSEFAYDEIIHIRDDFFFNDVFGDNPQKTLAGLMNTISTIDQSIVNAIKNSSVVKWLLKFTSSMRDEDLRIKANEFAENYLDITSNNAMGVAAVDSKAEAIQIKPYDFVPNALQGDRQVQRVYAFFNTNEKIVTSHYTEDEWISYYEASIEPVIEQMAGEYTRKLFTRRERGVGNKIVFESASLTFASMSTKLNLVSFVDRAIMTPNEVREYLGLAPIEGGDKVLLRKDTGKLEEREKEVE